mgnify:CR=1 FL=1|jgi:serine/threonine-protein kinase RsbW
MTDDNKIILNKSWKMIRKSSELVNLRNFLEEILNDINIDEKRKARMILCTDEAAANIIEHSNVDLNNEDLHEFEIEVFANENQLTVTIYDNGKPFDPTQTEDVDLSEHILSGKKGGLGVYIMKTQLDVFEYKYENDNNILKLGMNLGDK